MIEYRADKVLKKFDFKWFICKSLANRAIRAETRQLGGVNDNSTLKAKQAYNLSL